MASLGARIREARELAGLTQDALIAKCSFSKRSLIRYEKDQTEPGAGELTEIARTTDVSYEWLSTGQGGRGRFTGTPSRLVSPAGDGWSGSELIDFTREAHVDYVAAMPIVRSRAELQASTGYDAGALKPVWIEGDSMEPEIRANSWAWYLPAERVGPPGIYLVQVADHRIPKRFDVLHGGVLRMGAENRRSYQAEELEPVKAGLYRSRQTGVENPLRIVGRVVAFTRIA